MNPQSYGSGSAFRIALEARLKDRAATEDIDLQRLRRRVAFDRFLSRLAMQDRERWALKGGLCTGNPARHRQIHSRPRSRPQDLARRYARIYPC